MSNSIPERFDLASDFLEVRHETYQQLTVDFMRVLRLRGMESKARVHGRANGASSQTQHAALEPCARVLSMSTMLAPRPEVELHRR